MDKQEYIALGREAILTLLAREHAAIWLEVEAKVSEQLLQGLPTKIDPHNLTIARQQLRDEDVIVEVAAETRGGREVGVLHLADLTRRGEAVRAAAARKRLLQARYLGWAVGSPSQPGVIGPWGEHVVHEALRAAAPLGYLLVNPGGRVTTLFEQPVPGGELDAVAMLQLLDALGRPAGTVVLPIEVKNIRGWIYPSSWELYQLLDKAAQLQLANPDLSFLPIFVCRRTHPTTFYAAHDLGFLVVDLRVQFLPPSARIDPALVEEVRSELGYLDLAIGDEPPKALVRRLTNVVPKYATKFAAQWRQTAEVAGELFKALRDESLAPGSRRAYVNQLRDVARSLPGTKVSW